MSLNLFDTLLRLILSARAVEWLRSRTRTIAPTVDNGCSSSGTMRSAQQRLIKPRKAFQSKTKELDMPTGLPIGLGEPPILESF
jgi:hypothetical protein